VHFPPINIVKIKKGRMKKNKILCFVISFVFSIIILVFFTHTFKSKGVPPHSWSEIVNDWPFFIISGVFIAVMCTWLIDYNKK